ncbi:MAG: type II toxin-antitoxin system HicB family antitoxin [Cyanobacteria bacterium P01_A01_bin.83]
MQIERNYSIIIQWSDQENCFVARLPEWSDVKVRGESYETVLANAQQAIDTLIKSFLSQGRLLPEPRNFHLPSIAQ